MNIHGQKYLQAKHHRTTGSHRSRLPADTLAAYTQHMPLAGITRLANVTGLDRIGIPVFMAIRPNARSIAVSQGKGIDPEHAKVSALMESLENWHAEWIELPARMGSYREMCQRGTVIDITTLPLRAGAVLQPNNPIPWIEGYDLLQQQPVWVPYEYVTMNTLLSFSMQLTYFNSSNGLASGNHLLEAILHGLLELLERDALGKWHSTSATAKQQSKIHLPSIQEAACRDIVALFAQSDVDVAVWDVTSDFGIATYECAISEPKGIAAQSSLGVFHGWGCHLSPAVALSRALCEAAQSRLTAISGSRDDNPIDIYAYQNNAERSAAMHAACFDTDGTLPFGTRPDLSTARFEEDISVILDALRQAGLTAAIVVDLTRDDIGIPVAKVIVPGLKVGLHSSLENAGQRQQNARPVRSLP